MGCKKRFTMANEYGGVVTVEVYSEGFVHPFIENPALRESSKLWRKLNKVSRVDP
ncbi:MAG: hypothetical protein QXO67_03990 [Candidatus Bathyarchaeia archaeon]